MKYWFLLLLCCSSLYAQNEKSNVYLDFDYKMIDSFTYYNKCKKNFYKCLEYKTDSLSVSKIEDRFYFGKLDTNEYKQIISILERDGVKTTLNQNIIIEFYEKFNNYTTYLLNNEKHINSHLNKLRSTNPNKDITLNNYKIKDPTLMEKSHIKAIENLLSKKLNEKEFRQDQIDWSEKLNKRSIYYKKKLDVNFLNVYNSNLTIDVNKTYPKVSWIKDSGILKNLFFKLYSNYSSIIIKPNGEYLLNGGHLTEKKVKKLLKNNNWYLLKTKLEEAKKKETFKLGTFFFPFENCNHKFCL